MEYTESVIIKEEHDIDFSDNALDLLQMHLDVNVKIENGNAMLGDDWCTENKVLLQEIDRRFDETTYYGETIYYECHPCSRNFSDRHSLYKHNLQHLKVILERLPIFQCSHCLNSFTTKSQLIYHINLEHNKPRCLMKSGELITKSHHWCKVCDKVLPYKSWHGHMKQVHTVRRIQCSKCDKVFKCPSYLRKHEKYAHDSVRPRWRTCVTDQKLPCDECDKTFRCPGALKTHKNNCHSVRSYQCYICKSILKCKSYLLGHMRRVHYSDGLEHKCTICGKNYKSPRYLKIHMKNSGHKRKRSTRDNSIEV
ncbi:unnamed protein product, partial [Iphiclides podalirius]